MSSKLRDAEFDHNIYEYYLDMRDKYGRINRSRIHKSVKKKGYKRCPTCGGLVRLPCLLCSLDIS